MTEPVTVDWVVSGLFAVGSIASAVGISWGTSRTQISNVKEDVDALRGVPERLARIETNLTWLVNERKHRGAGDPPPPNDG